MVSPASRRAARLFLDKAVTTATASGSMTQRAQSRDWLLTANRPLHRVLDQAGIDPEYWHQHIVPWLRGRWWQDGGAG